MAEKTISGVLNEVALTWYWKWEFLRRNPEYNKDFKEWHHLFGELILDPNKLNDILSNEESNKKHSEYREKLEKEYGIVSGYPPNPEIYHPPEKFKKWIRAIEIEKKYIIFEPKPLPPMFDLPFFDICFHEVNENAVTEYARDGIYPHQGTRCYYFAKDNPVLLGVYINMTLPKEIIMYRLKQRIDFEIKRRKRKNLPVWKKKSRKRLKDYELYIKIWDKMKKLNKRKKEYENKFKQIIKELKLNMPEASIRAVYKTAEELIYGGYKNII